MNKVTVAHSGKLDKDGKPSYTLGGTGKVYVNGTRIEGVLDIVPNLLDRNAVASVTITLAVSEFNYEPEYVTFQAVGEDVERRLPTVNMRD